MEELDKIDEKRYAMVIAVLGNKEDIPQIYHNSEPRQFTTCLNLFVSYIIINNMHQSNVLCNWSQNSVYKNVCYVTKFCKDIEFVEQIKAKNIKEWDTISNTKIAFIYNDMVSAKLNSNIINVNLSVPKKYINALIISAIKNNDVEFLKSATRTYALPFTLLTDGEYWSLYVIAMKHKAVDIIKYLIEIDFPIISIGEIQELMLYMARINDENFWNTCLRLIDSTCGLKIRSSDFMVFACSIEFLIWAITNFRKITGSIKCATPYDVYKRFEKACPEKAIEMTELFISKLDKTPESITVIGEDRKKIKEFYELYAPFVSIV